MTFMAEMLLAQPCEKNSQKSKVCLPNGARRSEIQHEAMPRRLRVLFMEGGQSQIAAPPQPAAAAAQPRTGHRWTRFWSVENVSPPRLLAATFTHLCCTHTHRHTRCPPFRSVTHLSLVIEWRPHSACQFAFICEERVSALATVRPS